MKIKIVNLVASNYTICTYDIVCSNNRRNKLLNFVTIYTSCSIKLSTEDKHLANGPNNYFNRTLFT